MNGHPLPDADAASFERLDRPNFAKDRHHVYQLDRAISDDPAHFELLDGGLAKDSHVVYWSDGSVLSEDPSHFAIVSTADNYLFTKDSRAVHVNGKKIDGADPQTFRVLNSDFECSADDGRAYYRQAVITGADPRTFPPNRAVTNCSETSISFAQ